MKSVSMLDSWTTFSVDAEKALYSYKVSKLDAERKAEILRENQYICSKLCILLVSMLVTVLNSLKL